MKKAISILSIMGVLMACGNQPKAKNNNHDPDLIPNTHIKGQIHDPENLLEQNAPGKVDPVGYLTYKVEYNGRQVDQYILFINKTLKDLKHGQEIYFEKEKKSVDGVKVMVAVDLDTHHPPHH